MTRYEIPRPFLQGFEAIAKLSVEDSKRVTQILSGIPVGYTEKKLAVLLHEKCTFSELDSFNIAAVLFSLMPLKLNATTGNSDKFVVELAQAYSEQSKTDNKKEVAEKLRENLNILLEADGNLRLTQKAKYLQGEYEKVYLEARIISDVRLVYENAIENVAKHALVVHQLRVHFSENGEHKNLYFALDNNDLKKLKDIILRAELKDTQISNGTYTTGLQFIDFKEEADDDK
jgi:hypothetical protein